MNQNTPRGLRLHIGLFGRRNVGKSSLLNAITQQHSAIVSAVAGTTTDPVEKPMELLPVGPVLFIDTAGLDDEGSLGVERITKTRQVFARTDLGIVVTDGPWGDYEQGVVDALRALNTPIVVVHNKSDLGAPPTATLAALEAQELPWLCMAAAAGEGVLELRQAIIDHAPDAFIADPTIMGDLVEPGDTVVLVVPIDKEAPKGRLILAQVQTIRDLLDHDACCLVVKEQELSGALNALRRPPKLVVTDSQAFLQVAADTPPAVPLTSFSILFSRFKGDLVSQTLGALAIERLQSGDRILIAEACTHHPIAEDIGRVKIPRWLTHYVGGKLDFTTVAGKDFPDDLSPYQLIIHCGACTFNRKAVLSRLLQARAAEVPMTNYGMAIAFSLGILERALEPFPAALEALQRTRAEQQFGASSVEGQGGAQRQA
ncbi:[FeFe] hydrogenase H-cluster maturation GTPase HydF [Halorhodospira abdelmalekii]|uniref:[FeFe] hydrogenase H-cluster maturation GTPase HydF n=1 Tax=Halorhodospira abdelmalekii TaxID=421629 RepID=UPI0019038CBA|nr:[FeFe] hydrogenase H-cluster maturation GTPase HydF [Halorhodospira abdelmalekii]MBK1735432.1 [FeFe] hydrogenase H-cluster maturation GTPase HydF [Halorhodospira abdelmalekii]